MRVSVSESDGENERERASETAKQTALFAVDSKGLRGFVKSCAEDGTTEWRKDQRIKGFWLPFESALFGDLSWSCSE